MAAYAESIWTAVEKQGRSTFPASGLADWSLFTLRKREDTERLFGSAFVIAATLLLSAVLHSIVVIPGLAAVFEKIMRKEWGMMRQVRASEVDDAV